MVLEVAVLQIKEGLSGQFEQAFARAEKIISSMKGYISHEILKCVGKEDQFILLVRWETLEDHEVGFRKSPEYQEWKKLLHHFYNPFPVVEHYSKS